MFKGMGLYAAFKGVASAYYGYWLRDPTRPIQEDERYTWVKRDGTFDEDVVWDRTLRASNPSRPPDNQDRDGLNPHALTPTDRTCVVIQRSSSFQAR